MNANNRQSPFAWEALKSKSLSVSLPPRRYAGIGIALLALAFLGVTPAYSAGQRALPPPKSHLQISRNAITGKITISSTGKGVLREVSSPNGRAKATRQAPVPYTFYPTKDYGFFKLETSPRLNPLYTANVVGYVTLNLSPGLSLIANPLFFANNTVAYWWPEAPDGAQVLKYVAGVGYEVSTFDGLSGVWSNPNLEIPVGTGFFFRTTGPRDYGMRNADCGPAESGECGAWK